MILDTIHNEECLAGMARHLPDASIDMVLCDLPYGVTCCKWDAVIDIEKLWREYERVAKPKAAIVLTAQVPFSMALAAPRLRWLKHEWIWEKSNGSNFLNAKREPMSCHENVLVFCVGGRSPIYRPQMQAGKPYGKKVSGESDNYHYRRRLDVVRMGDEGIRHPRSVMKFKSDRGLHPTQKPVALFEHLVRSYTDPGMVVLDNCMGSGTTAVACLNAGRHYIGFEKDAVYFRKAQARIAARQLSSLPLAA